MALAEEGTLLRKLQDALGGDEGLSDLSTAIEAGLSDPDGVTEKLKTALFILNGVQTSDLETSMASALSDGESIEDLIARAQAPSEAMAVMLSIIYQAILRAGVTTESAS